MEEARGGNTGREAGKGWGEWLTQGKKKKRFSFRGEEDVHPRNHTSSSMGETIPDW